MSIQVTLTGISEVFSAADIECLVRAAGEAVCGDLDSLSSLERALAERAYALTQAEYDAVPENTSPLGSIANPETVHVRDSEIRVYNLDTEPESDDASDMYVMEVFGLALRIRLRRSDPDDSAAPAAPSIHIDNEDREPCTIAVEVGNGGGNDYQV